MNKKEMKATITAMKEDIDILVQEIKFLRSRMQESEDSAAVNDELCGCEVEGILASIANLEKRVESNDKFLADRVTGIDRLLSLANKADKLVAKALGLSK